MGLRVPSGWGYGRSQTAQEARSNDSQPNPSPRSSAETCVVSFASPEEIWDLLSSFNLRSDHPVDESMPASKSRSLGSRTMP